METFHKHMLKDKKNNVELKNFFKTLFQVFCFVSILFLFYFGGGRAGARGRGGFEGTRRSVIQAHLRIQQCRGGGGERVTRGTHEPRNQLRMVVGRRPPPDAKKT